MSDISRRIALQRLALTFAAAGVIDAADAATAHHVVQDAARAAGGRYAPKALTAPQFAALERLTDLILPADGGKPGARQADVAAWIDTMLAVSDPLKARYTTGLAWIDEAVVAKGAKSFVKATPAQQTALLDVIAFRKNQTPETEPGVEFFVLLRRMTCDGFYTSAIGMRDVYKGNAPQAAFTVPQAAIDHVLNASPLK
jgi:gluconate 2-dehydrogenase gamma chain